MWYASSNLKTLDLQQVLSNESKEEWKAGWLSILEEKGGRVLADDRDEREEHKHSLRRIDRGEFLLGLCQFVHGIVPHTHMPLSSTLNEVSWASLLKSWGQGIVLEKSSRG
ncbi:hypothetical protein NPIL_200921 [Nephila pilipes]|uniref:Uncharacterized protein n=1 Tax=Nephila pilipes TaxID=299642 RepID=A0A8X6TIF1_NEPPI|nr:hypothetical protein NPIL_200921 [Nephila pilipes]